MTKNQNSIDTLLKGNGFYGASRPATYQELMARGYLYNPEKEVILLRMNSNPAEFCLTPMNNQTLFNLLWPGQELDVKMPSTPLHFQKLEENLELIIHKMKATNIMNYDQLKTTLFNKELIFKPSII